MLFKEDAVARKEAMAVRNDAGWYRWQHDLVEVSGPDAAGFLDFVCVNDIAGAAQGVSKYTTLLNDDGKIIDDVIVTNMGDDVYWVSTLYAPKFAKWFEKKSGGFECSMRELTNEIDMYAVQGPKSPDVMNGLLDTPVDGEAEGSR